MHDLDLTSAGHSRSKLIVPNERAYMTSYSLLEVSLAVSASISKLEIPTLEIEVIVVISSIFTHLH